MSPFRTTLLTLTVVAVAGSAVALGCWQLRRLDQRKKSNAAIEAARAMPPLVLPRELPADRTIDSGRRIVATGHFDTTGQVILRGRVQNDGPGLQIVTPFLLDSTDAVLWVLRGFVPSPDAVTPPDSIVAPAAGTVTVTGAAQAVPISTDSGAPLMHGGRVSWKRLDRAALRARHPRSLDVYLVLEGDSTGPGRLPPSPLPELSNGPHLSYAIQWFGIALAVVTFGIIVLWRAGRGSPRPDEAP